MSVGTDPIEEEDKSREELWGHMSFLDHLEELRIRLINIFVAVGLSFAICFYFSKNIYNFIAFPIESAVGTLNYMAITEPFNLLLYTSFIVSLFCAAPIIMGEIWRFISPGLYKHEKRYALPFIVSSAVLFMTGMAFAYFYAFPYAVAFLVSVGSDMGMKPVINASEYFDLFLMIMLALGIVFEIPAVIFILSRLGLVSGPFLLKNTKYAILLSTIVAAVITPTTDIANMMIVAVPMMGLYMLGVVVAYVFGKKRKKEVDD
jgi:sec-independent protein translocase protein TatC